VLGLDARASTPALKRKMIVFAAETRSYKRASIVAEEALGFKVSINTLERVALDAGLDLTAVRDDDWKTVLTGEVTPPDVAIIENDGGRIRTRVADCGPGVHLSGKGWNETKNAILVSAASSTSDVDPQPDPPACFLREKHVAKLTETAKTKENTAENEALPEPRTRPKTPPKPRPKKRPKPAHKPRRILRTVLSSLQNSAQFGAQVAREARRRKFHQAARKAFVADGLACNWTMHAEHFADYAPILDFTHAVTYLFRAAQICCCSTDEAWATYARWMTSVWRGGVSEVLAELAPHQARLGMPPEDVADDDPREQLRLIVGYLSNHRARMRYDEYRRRGLPTTSAWMESAVKEVNYRVKGTEMFWNNPDGAEAILQIRAAALSDDGRLARFLARRPGCPTVRRPPLAQAA
jgi:hypothetical protein